MEPVGLSKFGQHAAQRFAAEFGEPLHDPVRPSSLRWDLARGSRLGPRVRLWLRSTSRHEGVILAVFAPLAEQGATCRFLDLRIDEEVTGAISLIHRRLGEAGIDDPDEP